MTTWIPVSCTDRDRIYRANTLRPGATRTDLSGQFGEPEIYTEWINAAEVPVLRDRRWPSVEDGKPDVRPCQHWIPEMNR